MLTRSFPTPRRLLWAVGAIIFGLALQPFAGQAAAQTSPAAQTASGSAESAWTFREGDRWYVVDKVAHSQTTTITYEGSDEKPLQDARQSERTTISRFDILSVRPTGDIDMSMTLLDIQNRSGQSTELGRRVAGVEFRWRVTPVGEIVDFEGYEKFVSQVSAGNLEFARLLETILSPQTLQQTALEFLQTAPRRNESFETGWERQTQVSLGPLGELQIRRAFQSASDERRPPELPGLTSDFPTRHVKFRGTARYVPPDGSSRKVTFEIKSGDLTVQELEGSAWFEPQDRRLAVLETRLKVLGTFEMKVGEDRATVTLEQTENSVLHITTRDPRTAAAGE